MSQSIPGRVASAAIGTTICLLLACRAIVPVRLPEPSEIETSLFLIGDAGEPDPREGSPALDSLTAQAAVAPERNVIVFLGDNVYPHGIPAEGQAEFADARRRLAAQVNAIPAGVRGIFIPGNHDWASMEAYGLYAVRRQEQLIRALAAGRDIRMLPSNGCPGPATFDTGRVRLIAMDTQWWLHEYIVKDSATRCETRPAAVTEALRQELRSGNAAPGRVAIVAGHHPLMTGGEHGAYCGLISPLRRVANRSQDIVSTANRAMRDSLESAFSASPPLAYVAGHDHSHQVLRGGPNVRHLLVTGAGSKVSCAVRLRESEFTSQNRTGFMRLDIMRGSGVLLRVYHFDDGGQSGRVYAQWLQERAP